MAVGMMGSGFVGQEQVWSFMPPDRHNMWEENARLDLSIALGLGLKSKENKVYECEVSNIKTQPQNTRNKEEKKCLLMYPKIQVCNLQLRTFWKLKCSSHMIGLQKGHFVWFWMPRSHELCADIEQAMYAFSNTWIFWWLASVETLLALLWDVTRSWVIWFHSVHSVLGVEIWLFCSWLKLQQMNQKL